MDTNLTAPLGALIMHCLTRPVCIIKVLADQQVLIKQPGTKAQSVPMSLGNQEPPRSILASGTSFRENISTAIFPLPLIQEKHLSVNGEMMCAKYW